MSMQNGYHHEPSEKKYATLQQKFLGIISKHSLFKLFALFAALLLTFLHYLAMPYPWDTKLVPVTTFACDGTFCHINNGLSVN